MASLMSFSRLLRIGTRVCPKNIGVDLLMKRASPAVTLIDSQIRTYRKITGVPRYVPWLPKEVPGDYQTEVTDPTIEEEKLVTVVSKEINKQIAENKTGRLFAIIHLSGKQYKITESDIIVVRGYWPPQPGDQINLEKVLLVGSTDFTLVGRPILNRELVSVDATVIDKTFSHILTQFRFRKRKQYRRIHFHRYQLTTLRINSITLKGKVNQKLEVEGLDRVY